MLEKLIKRISICCLILILTIMLYITILNTNFLNSNNDNSEWNEYLRFAAEKNNEIIQYIQSKSKSDSEYNTPYIPENFEYLEGDIQSGYVVQDKQGNQYVWVPCSVCGENSLKLERRNFETINNIHCNETYENASDIYVFLDSVYKYGGFYIARYEAGIEDNNVVSKANVNVYDKISQEEAIEKCFTISKDSNYTTSLINSYAWDTAIQWIENTNSNLIKYKSIDNYYLKNMTTGKEKINNIFDIQGNAIEMTTELYDGTAVIRDNVDFYSEYSELGCRSSILTTEKLDGIGFRFILYKNI